MIVGCCSRIYSIATLHTRASRHGAGGVGERRPSHRANHERRSFTCSRWSVGRSTRVWLFVTAALPCHRKQLRFYGFPYLRLVVFAIKQGTYLVRHLAATQRARGLDACME